MANKQSLRDLQTRLAERMQQVRTEEARVSWLAVDCAGQGLLFALRQAGEIFKLGTVLPVPHTQPWLTGVVNLRGGICTVVDLAAFLGLRTAERAVSPTQCRLVGFSDALQVNGALLVDRLEGLRHAADLKPVAESTDNGAAVEAPEGHRPAFALARWRDEAGRVWQEIDLAELASMPQFLAVMD
jgi:twitching motility protein PilI